MGLSNVYNSRDWQGGWIVAAGLALLAGGWLLKRVTLEDDVLVVAHRGAAGAAPENTIASIRRAMCRCVRSIRLWIPSVRP